ncbi:hypothetical protein [Streptomyces sp. PKU-EA00015]|uniref:hypothetical protein n=1 Tax=Streptomyces sp. PKU-EA00015 TaxID=2748326 RepID=UPI0021088554|nr:hypothetical protein [Streptomyces sp. PKU-EA00015]
MPADTPTPITACWLHWLAIPTGDQAAVLDAMGLTDPRPTDFAQAVEAVDDDAHDPDHGYDRVFVTPELDGWTLVVGAWCDPTEDDMPALCEQLSARFGKAQAYYHGAQSDGSAWLVAENGHVVRRAAFTGEPDDEELTIGEPLPFEVQCRAEAGDDDEWDWLSSELAPKLAEALSINPHTLGPHTPTRGHGVLARTPQAPEA